MEIMQTLDKVLHMYDILLVSYWLMIALLQVSRNMQLQKFQVIIQRFLIDDTLVTFVLASQLDVTL
jgi:hypothetical protein